MTPLSIMLLRLIIVLGAVALFASANEASQESAATRAEGSAIQFLTREVPAWSKKNGCFSCHNNGDAARALYAATQKGYRLSPDVLADTTAWVREPSRWDHNKGDPGFSDKRLANIQFSASLLSAVEAGHVGDRRSLQMAASKLAADQAADGAWHIDQGNTLGSPATYGTALATQMALRSLRAGNSPGTESVARKAEEWLGQLTPHNVLTAATILQSIAQDKNRRVEPRLEECLRIIRNAQTRDGGWGPYADSPPEVFDTAVVLLALAQVRTKDGVEQQVRRGRSFLVAQQNRDGSWPATTRPSGGDSYAQMISTTGWAALALLETR